MAILIGKIYLHIVLGVFWSVATYYSGTGVNRFFSQMKKNSIFADVQYAYPVGILVLTTVSFLILQPILPLLLVGISIGIAVLFMGVVGNDDVWGGLLGHFRYAIPSVLYIGIFSGLRLHGPTHDLFADPLGDTIQYASMLEGLRAFGWTVNLTVEGYTHSILQYAPIAIGALSSTIPGIDPFLFYSVSCPVFFVSSMAFGIIFMVRHRADSDLENIKEFWPWLAVFLLIASAPLYPAWLVESPPVAFVFPLCFTVVHVLYNRSYSAKEYITICGFILLAAALTKVVTIFPFGVILGYGFFKKGHGQALWETSAIKLVTYIFGAFALILYFAYKNQAYLFDYEPYFLPLSLFKDGFPKWPYFLELVTNLALLLPPFLLGSFGWVLAFFLSTFLYWLWPSLMGVNMGVLQVFFAILLFIEYKRFKKYMKVIWVYCVLVVLGSYGREPFHSLMLAPPWAIILAMAFAMLPVLSDLRILEKYKLRSQFFATNALVLLLILSLGVASRVLGQNLSTAGIFTPAEYDIYENVKGLTSEEGLIFTDLTGGSSAINFFGAWNYFSGMGRRQFYLAGWLSTDLRVNRQELSKRLSYNSKVISGRLMPSRVPTSKKYRKFYALLRRGTSAPRYFKPIYQNTRYVLYAIQ